MGQEVDCEFAREIILILCSMCASGMDIGLTKGDGSDVHIYYFQENTTQKKFARELWERIRRECESSPYGMGSLKLFITCTLFAMRVVLTTLQSQSSVSTSFGRDQLVRILWPCLK